MISSVILTIKKLIEVINFQIIIVKELRLVIIMNDVVILLYIGIYEEDNKVMVVWCINVILVKIEVVGNEIIV